MIDEALWILVALIILAIGFVKRPQHAQCPRGEFVNGVRPSGNTWCVRAPSAREVDCRGARRCFATEAPVYTTPIKIYCTNGTRPIVVDDRTVGCQR